MLKFIYLSSFYLKIIVVLSLNLNLKLKLTLILILILKLIKYYLNILEVFV